MKKRNTIFILLTLIFLGNVAYANANYAFNIKSIFPTGQVNVEATKKYYIHFKELEDKFSIGPNNKQLIEVVGNSGADWYTTDLELSIYTPDKHLHTVRIHQTGAGASKYDIFIDGNKVDTTSSDELNTNYGIIFNPQGPYIETKTNSDWMKNLSDGISLNKIIMPGSHDAGMGISPLEGCTFGITQDMARTQKYNIIGQLEAGSRYFDIRPSYSDSKKGFVTYHRTSGWGCNGQTIVRYDGTAQTADVLEEVYTFLKSHPTETVILNISHPRWGNGKDANDLAEAIEEYNSKHGSIFLPKSNAGVSGLKLGMLRGHAIIILSKDIYDDIKNPNTTFWPESALPVYDEYTGTTDLETMKKDQLNKLSSFGGLGGYQLFLLSWTLTGNIEKLNIEALAKKANAALPNTIENDMGYKQPNIVYLDFIDSSLTRPVIDLAYKYSK